MTTDKEKADAYRSIADIYDSIGANVAANYCRSDADELDPPKPACPDGTIAWVTGTDKMRRLCLRRKDVWVARFEPDGLVGSGIYDSSASKVEPLRVLGDDEIPVRRVDGNAEALRDLAAAHYKARRKDSNDSLPRLSINARAVIFAYADALEAEGK